MSKGLDRDERLDKAERVEAILKVRQERLKFQSDMQIARREQIIKSINNITGWFVFIALSLGIFFAVHMLTKALGTT